jgi:ABC-type transport system involved in Fe-S cluster assembly fused permease/ATPase subunit
MRQQMNEYDNQGASISLDSLINYEPVKVCNNTTNNFNFMIIQSHTLYRILLSIMKLLRYAKIQHSF